MSTRRYSRTLLEAFPQHYAWRGVLTRHRRPLAERVADVVFTAALAAGAAVLAFMYLSR